MRRIYMTFDLIGPAINRQPVRLIITGLRVRRMVVIQFLQDEIRVPSRSACARALPEDEEVRGSRLLG